MHGPPGGGWIEIMAAAFGITTDFQTFTSSFSNCAVRPVWPPAICAYINPLVTPPTNASATTKYRPCLFISSILAAPSP